MQRFNPKFIRLAGIVLAFFFIIILIGGYIAYSKRGAFLERAIAKAKQKAKNNLHAVRIFNQQRQFSIRMAKEWIRTAKNNLQ